MFYEIRPSEKAAFIASDGSRITYGELSGRVCEAAKLLDARRVCFCLCENSIQSVVNYLSCLNAGTVPLLLSKEIDHDLLDNLIRTYRPEYMFVTKSRAEEPKGYARAFASDGYVLLKATEQDRTPLAEDLALLLTTSGSTGSPKLVRQSYRNIQSNAEAIAEYLRLDENQRPVTTLPMNYTYGLSILNSHLLVGATILLTDLPMNMKGFWTFMKSERATSFGGVPFTYEMLKKVRIFKMDLPDLEYMTQAGGKIRPELHREFAEWAENTGKKFIVMYGQTEATARMAYLPPEKSLEKVGCMGIAIPGGSFSLLDADGNVISECDTVGELVYEGPNVTMGYSVCRTDLEKGDERNGRLVTGDMAKRDADGYYTIVGRKKRFLKVFGNRVNLDELERIIVGAFPGLECAAAGKDDLVRLFITDASKAEEVRGHAAAVTHLSESAFSVEYLETIPKNDSGKILYKDLPKEEQ
ncbi:MAG: AMP-binding protein [Clostridiales bacterium]|nr:AMP-binding protein [Clostridiales bacterium]